MTTPGGLNILTRHRDTKYQTTYRMNASYLNITIQSPYSVPWPLPELVRFAVYRSARDDDLTAINPGVTECSWFLTAYKYDGAHANGSTFAFDEIREVDFGVNPWKKTGSLIYTNESEAGGIPALSISKNNLQALQNFFESNAIVSEWVDGHWTNTDFGLSAALGGDVNFGQRFEKMLIGMTDYLRSGPNMKPVFGGRIDRKSFISIRWHYLVGPIVIELAALLFAGITIFSNRKSSRVPLWKSSSLAVLGCTHIPETDLIQAKVKDMKRIETVAESSLVRLE